MTGRSASLRVGLLILVGVVLALGFVWFFGGRTISHADLYETYFSESVQGLEVGAAVKYRGVTLGRVNDIGLVTAEYGDNQPVGISPLPPTTEASPWSRRDRSSYRQVFVRYELDRAKLGAMPDTATAVNLGLRARLASQGLTGLSYIELDFVDPDGYPAEIPPWQPKAAYIPSMPSTLSQVQDAAQQVLAKLNTVDMAAVAASLTRLLDDLHTELSTGDVHVTAEKLQATLRTLQGAVQAADLPGLSAEWRQTARSVRDTAQSPNTRRLLAGGAQAADQLARITAQLPPLLAALQATAQHADSGTADLQRGLAPLLRDLQATVQNLREITEELRQAPAQVLLGAPPPRSFEEQTR